MLKKIAANRLTIPRVWCIIYSVAGEGGAHGSIAQLVEHLPYKQGVTGSSPVVSTTSYVCGPVVQLVRTLACHARGRRFEPVPGRHFAVIAQSAEHFLGKEEVTSSNLVSSSSYFAWIRVNALFMRILFFFCSTLSFTE